MKIALVANTDRYLLGYRIDLARYLQASGHQVTLISPPGKYSPGFSELGFEWKSLTLSRKGVNPIAELKSLLQLMRFYQQANFDVVHHFTIKVVLYGSIAAKLAHIPKIVNSITGLGHIFTSKAFLISVVRFFVMILYRLFFQGTKVIFQNRDDMQFFVSRRLIDEGQVRLIEGSGVDVDRFVTTTEPQGTPRIILVSRLLWEKGVGEFVEAAAALKSRGHEIECVLVGDTDDGNPNAIPRNVINDWVQQKIVKWDGWIEDMPEVYAKSHIVCLPSYYGEGLPKTLIEAAACGRPLVAADISGSREIVQDGLNGFLVPAKNVVALADALEKLIVSPQLRLQMGIFGRNLAENRFSSAKIDKQTLAVYLEA